MTTTKDSSGRAKTALVISDDETDEWEDVTHGSHLNASSKESDTSPRPKAITQSPSYRNKASPRKRKVHIKGGLPNAVGRNNMSSSVTENEKRMGPSFNVQWGEPLDKSLETLRRFLVFTVRYGVEVFSSAIRYLRYPLAFLVFLYLLGYIISCISSTIQSAFRPFCIIPGISSSGFCNPGRVYRDAGRPLPKHADYPKLVEVQSSTFEQLLDSSAPSLSLDVKMAEMATADLVTLVKVSDLKCRDSLSSSLSAFVHDAKKTGRGLQKLNSKVNGAVDTILGINDYAMKAIAEAQAPSSFSLSLRSLVPFLSGPSSKDIVLETFADVMDTLSVSIEKLILEAEVQHANLVGLEESLSVIHESVSREDSSLVSDKSELLADLWTKLGWNRAQLRSFEDKLKMLKGLEGYRKKALLHVVTALHALRSLSDDMEELRERVQAPETPGTKIPVEVHLKSIRHGLERLQQGRIKAEERKEAAFNRILDG